MQLCTRVCYTQTLMSGVLTVHGPQVHTQTTTQDQNNVRLTHRPLSVKHPNQIHNYKLCCTYSVYRIHTHMHPPIHPQTHTHAHAHTHLPALDCSSPGRVEEAKVRKDTSTLAAVPNSRMMVTMATAIPSPTLRGWEVGANANDP